MPLMAPSLMPVEDVFSISGRGTVVTGPYRTRHRQSRKRLRLLASNRPLKTTCTGVEMFRKLLDQGQAGDNVGVLLRGVKRETSSVGGVLEAGFDHPHTKFQSEVYIPVERRELVVMHRSSNGYRPQFYFRTTDVTGSIRAAGRLSERNGHARATTSL